LKSATNLNTLRIRHYSRFSPDLGASVASDLTLNSSLRFLQLTGRCVRDKGVVALAQAIKNHPNLTRLELGCTLVLDEGVAALANVIANSSSITTFALFGQPGDICEGGFVLAEALKLNSSITSLVLRDLTMDGHQLGCFGDMLEVNSTLTLLDLSNRRSKDRADSGMRKIAHALRKKNTTLRILHMRKNGICGEGTHLLFGVLKENPTLKHLNLSGNWIGENESSIREGLIRTTSLISLNLSSGNLTDYGITQIGKAIERNTSIKRINISNNTNNTRRPLPSLFRGLSLNETITELNIMKTRITQEDIELLAVRISQTSSLTSLYFSLPGDRPSTSKLLYNAMKTNSTITSLYLDLAESPLGIAASVEFGKILLSSSTLRHLVFSNHVLGYEESKILFQGVDLNTSLLTLHFTPKYSIILENRLELFQILSDNKVLIRLPSRHEKPIPLFTQICKRNEELWKERLFWCCKLTVLARALMVGGELGILPNEMIDYLLSFLPPSHLLSQREIRNAINYGFANREIGSNREDMIEQIFGKGVSFIFDTQ